ncbi:MAG: DUF3305 domain-containing protein [Ectothiorhodospiraceae bacterium]
MPRAAETPASTTSYQGVRTIPVGVMIASERQDDGWHSRVDGVVSGHRFQAESPQRQCMREGEGLRLDLWTGFRLHLRKRFVNDYALNIRNEAPSVYVVHRCPEPGAMEPFLVTVSMDEAQKLDAPELRDPADHVARAPMPPEVYRWVEEFVLDHYEPRKPKGKRRQES